MNVANADLTSHSPVSPSTTNAWHADVLTVESSLLHLDESNLNSDIYKKRNVHMKTYTWKRIKSQFIERRKLTFEIFSSVSNFFLIISISLDIACGKTTLSIAAQMQMGLIFLYFLLT